MEQQDKYKILSAKINQDYLANYTHTEIVIIMSDNTNTTLRMLHSTYTPNKT